MVEYMVTYWVNLHIILKAGLAVLNYAVVGTNLMPFIKKLQVHLPNNLSDHSTISLHMKMKHEHINQTDNLDDNLYLMIKLK